MHLKITQNGARTPFRPAFCRQEDCPARAENPFCPSCGADIAAYLDAVGGGSAAGAVQPAPAAPATERSTAPPAAGVDAAATRELPVLVLPPHIGTERPNGNGNGHGAGPLRPGAGGSPPSSNGHSPSDDHGDDDPSHGRWSRAALVGGGLLGATASVAAALTLGLL